MRVPFPLLVTVVPVTTVLMVPVIPALTVTMASAPNVRMPVVPVGLIALEAVKRRAPLVLVSVIPSLIDRSAPDISSELMATVAAAVVALVMRVLLVAVMALLVNSSVGFRGLRPVVA